MLRKPVTPRAAWRLLADNLGSIRGVYLAGNTIPRRCDLSAHEEVVLLLHGFFQTRAIWNRMEERLRADGFGVFSVDPGGLLWRFNTRPIDEMAAWLAWKVEGVCAKYGLERIHIVGHSKGGLVARRYVQDHGGARRVKSVITLGTPHHGTPTAALGVVLMAGGLLSRNPYEMLPRSRFIRELADRFPPEIPLVSIYSRHDLVCPWWCSRLRTSPQAPNLRNHAVRGVGHSALTFDPGVYLIVRRELELASERARAGRGASRATG